jgi:hypothetical protein
MSLFFLASVVVELLSIFVIFQKRKVAKHIQDATWRQKLAALVMLDVTNNTFFTVVCNLITAV